MAAIELPDIDDVADNLKNYLQTVERLKKFTSTSLRS